MGTLVKGYLHQVDRELPRARIRTECACCFCQPGLPWQGHSVYLKVPGQWQASVESSLTSWLPWKIKLCSSLVILFWVLPPRKGCMIRGNFSHSSHIMETFHLKGWLRPLSITMAGVGVHMASSFTVNSYATSIFAEQLINHRKFHWKRFKKRNIKKTLQRT